MVLEVLPDTGQRVHDIDTDRLEVLGIAHAGELEELRRVDRAAAEDHLARRDPLDPAPVPDVDADRARAVEHDAQHECATADLEVRAVRYGMEVRARRAPAAAVADRAVERAEAFLAVPVDVGGALVAGLGRRLEERAEELVRRRPALEDERPARAPVEIRPSHARLHALEVREAVRVAPSLEPRLGRPLLVVEGVPALE